MKTPIETINAFYQHIITKNVEGITNSYVKSEELYVILEGPRLSNRGYSNISKGWVDFCASGLTLDSIEWIEGPYEEPSNGMAWVGGVIVLTVSVGGKTFTQTFRSSFVLTKKGEEVEWKIKHEHVSAALEDPYGIGDWLKAN